MFNKKIIEQKLIGITGFNQPFDPDFAILDASNLESRSGYFVNDNPFAKVRWIKETQDYLELSDTDFNTYLNRLQQSAISNVCNKVFNQSSYLDRNLLFKNSMNKVNTESLNNGFVGYNITVSSQKNVAFEIKRVLLDFAGTGDIELMLFNTNKLTPLFAKTITITSDHQEEELNWTVDNSGDTYKGEYYLGYNTDGLTVQPYKRDYQNSDIFSIFTYLGFERIFVDGHNTNTLFDLTTTKGLSQTIGINPDITVYEDYTDLIVNNEMLFGYAVYLQTAINCIQHIITNTRSNKDQRSAGFNTSRLMLEVEGQSDDGNKVKITGLKPLLIGELSRLSEEIDNLNKGYFGDGFAVITLS